MRPPEKFFDVLGAVLADAPPMDGEEARYEQVHALLDAAASDPKIKAAIVDAATDAEKTVIAPLIEFRLWGLQLPYHWSTQGNGAQFDTDYFMRTAVARSKVFVNRPNETRYFYQDLDSGGGRLNGAKAYTVTFGKDQTPPVNGFWSVTLYNEHHFFAPNDLKRYSIGTKNRQRFLDASGSTTGVGQGLVMTIETARLVMRPHRVDDFGRKRGNGDRLQTFCGTSSGVAVDSRAELEPRPCAIARDWTLLNYGCWVSGERETVEFVGEAALQITIARCRSPRSTAYRNSAGSLHAKRRGKGYNRGRSSVALRWSRTNFPPATQIASMTAPENAASVRVAEKCGFRL